MPVSAIPMHSNWWVEIYGYLFPGSSAYGYDITILKNIAGYMKNQKDLGQAAKRLPDLSPRTHDDAVLIFILPWMAWNRMENITYHLYILAAIAILILCIASVNYTNLQHPSRRLFTAFRK